MIKKTVIAALCLLAILSAAFVFADNDFLKAESDTVAADSKLDFTIDLQAFTGEEAEPFSVVLSVEPTDPVVDIDLQEDVDVTYNKSKGTYTVRSGDIGELQELHFVIRPDKGIEANTEYTLTAEIARESGTESEDITFTVTPAEEPTEEPTEETTEETSETETQAETEPSANPEAGGGFGDGGSAPEEPEYKGSSNNYLASLSVSGHKMTQKFHKTRNTYFVDLEKTVTALGVNAAAEDRTAKVDIVGNENVSVDMSKIVINVTAQNGDVRVYTIYVRYK